MRTLIGVDSLAYLTIDGLYRSVGEICRNNDVPQYCDSCFTGEYPIQLVDHDKGAKIVNISILRDHDRYGTMKK
jgi:amidophosphoribosyltransferase